MTYHEYEKSVFDWLMKRHKKDPKFTFSVRQVASKDAELDYFIGNENRNYFSTTFWTIPIYYPGASTDLIDLIFGYSKSGNFKYYIQFFMTRSPFEDQNKLALELIQNINPKLKQKVEFLKESPENNKMESFYTKSPNLEYENFYKMMKDVEKDLNIVLPIVDKAIKEIKSSHKEFTAHRITEEEFSLLLDKLNTRFEKYKETGGNKLKNKNDTKRLRTKNIIMFGPPGTGKTYNTIEKAVQLADPQFYSTGERKDLKARYEELVSDGRIAFTTFHQSLSYEDFIEGIKPQKMSENDTFLQFEVEPGIFKRICNRAKIFKSSEANINWKNPRFYKMSLGGKHKSEIHDWCLEHNVIALGYGGSEDLSQIIKERNWEQYRDLFTNKYPDLVKESRYNIQSTYSFSSMKKNDIVVVSKGNHIIDAIGIVKSEYYWSDQNPIDYYHFRDVEWVLKDMNTSPDRFLRKKISQMTIYEFDKADVIIEAFEQLSEEGKEKIRENYVLIIDEINRGNISQIFGELITLIEPDKRLGMNEAIEVTLPYSKEKFGVPSNLHVIGTMNTADRSVEALDSALRRRFEFEEIAPDSSIVKLDQLNLYANNYRAMAKLSWTNKQWLAFENGYKELLVDHLSYDAIPKKELEGIDQDIDNGISGFKDIFEKFNVESLPEKILETINKRIEKMLDKDHMIGHSYFLGIHTLHDLIPVFDRKIIPLLQEYFFGDFAKIGLILGKGFFKDPDLKQNVSSDFFADFSHDALSDIREKHVWRFKSPEELTSDFRRALDILLNNISVEERAN